MTLLCLTWSFIEVSEVCLFGFFRQCRWLWNSIKSSPGPLITSGLTPLPPHSPISIIQCISRVEGIPALAWHADLFADTSCDTPLKEGYISILHTDDPGLSPNGPMAIVQVKTHQSLMGGISLDIKQQTYTGLWGINTLRRYIFVLLQGNVQKIATTWRWMRILQLLRSSEDNSCIFFKVGHQTSY